MHQPVAASVQRGTFLSRCAGGRRTSRRSRARKVTDGGEQGTWHYRLVGETAVANSSTFEALDQAEQLNATAAGPPNMPVATLHARVLALRLDRSSMGWVCGCACGCWG